MDMRSRELGARGVVAGWIHGLHDDIIVLDLFTAWRLIERCGHPGFLFAMIDGRQPKGRYMPFHSGTGYRSATEASRKLLPPGLMIIARYHQASRHIRPTHSKNNRHGPS